MSKNNFNEDDILETFFMSDWLSQVVTGIETLEAYLTEGGSLEEAENGMPAIGENLKKVREAYKKLSPSAQEALNAGLELKLMGAMIQYGTINMQYDLADNPHDLLPLMEELNDMFT